MQRITQKAWIQSHATGNSGYHPWAGLNAILMGSFHQDMNQGAIAVVLHDERGNFHGGRVKWYDHGLNALMMESLACRDGMVYVRERGI